MKKTEGGMGYVGYASIKGRQHHTLHRGLGVAAVIVAIVQVEGYLCCCALASYGFQNICAEGAQRDAVAVLQCAARMPGLPELMWLRAWQHFTHSMACVSVGSFVARAAVLLLLLSVWYI